ncbi:MAG TPA: hypothetical protein EYP79_00945 [Campylobacterales bacterium]|nr:hypothetical protein [Campylobacterales bacterium]
MILMKDELKIEDKKIEEFIIDPKNVSINYAKFDDILGGNAILNAKITREILSGELKGPKRDIVLLNSAAALLVDKKVSSLEDGIQMAKEAIDSKKALKKLEEIIKISNSLA